MMASSKPPTTGAGMQYLSRILIFEFKYEPTMKTAKARKIVVTWSSSRIIVPLLYVRFVMEAVHDFCNEISGQFHRLFLDIEIRIHFRNIKAHELLFGSHMPQQLAHNEWIQAERRRGTDARGSGCRKRIGAQRQQ